MISKYRSKHIDFLLDNLKQLEDKKKVILASYVLVKECWHWTKGTNDRGRAIMKVGGRNHNTARVSFVVFKEEAIGDLEVCHSCDNVLCVNPEHLWLGTHLDNMKDMSSKGRRDGEANPKCKLTNDIVVEIRKKLEQGLSQRRVSKMYSISRIHVSRILKRESWDHI